MIREILFKGKRVDNGDWVYGYYCYCTDGNKCSHRIYSSFAESYGENTLHPVMFEVIPETVIQYTGQDDRNDTRTFEGDILRDSETDSTYRLYFNKDFSAFFIVDIGNPLYIERLISTTTKRMEVIGNIYDNQELLRGEQHE